MNLSQKRKIGVNISILLLIGIVLFIYACGSGSGGGGGSSADAGGSGTLHITDDMSIDYQQVIVTIYKAEFEKTDGSAVTVFEDSLGITYDLSSLYRVITKLPNSSVPAGGYSKVNITVGKEMVLVDNTGSAMSPNPVFSDNSSTLCGAEQCVLTVPGVLNVVDKQRVLLDFDLKQFVYDPATNSVTAKIVLDSDCSGHSEYNEMKEDDYEVKGIIKSINSSGFEMMIIKAEHFRPDSNIVNVVTDAGTVIGCDDDDGDDRDGEDDDHSSMSCTTQSLDSLKIGMKVEVYGDWNNSEYKASRVEVDEDDDIKS